MQIPIQTILRFQIFQVFQKIYFFTVSIPYTAQLRKVKSAKNHFLLLFYSAKSISDHFTISELFQDFSFKKLICFIVLTPYTAQVRKVKSTKNHFLVLFYSAKSLSDHFTIPELFKSFFFKNSIFFTVSNLKLQRWETWGQKTNHF